jgi:hypothetical protein
LSGASLRAHLPIALGQHDTSKLRIHDIKETFEAMKAAVMKKAADNMLNGLSGQKIDPK